MISVLVLIPFGLVIVGLILTIYVLKSNRQPDIKPEPELEDEFVEIRVASHDGKAYWIINEQLYRADLLEDGEIDHATTEAVDSMTIDFEEMPLLFNIVEALKQDGS